MKYVLDTHALIWFLEGNPRLGKNAKTILSDPNSELVLPAIVLAEAAWIVERGRTSIPSVLELFRVCWINLKTLLDRVFRLVFPQKVPTFGVIGGKIQVLFPWKLGNWPPQNR